MTADDNQLPDNNAAVEGTSFYPDSLRFYAVVFLLLLLTSCISYAMSLSRPALLDEQFLLSWLSHIKGNFGSPSLGNLFLWHGFDPMDQWGPVTAGLLTFGGLVCGTNVLLYKIAALLLHCFCALSTYAICRLLSAERKVSLAAAFLFAIYPLSAETVSWLGGIGSLVATTFFLVSLICYLSGLKGGKFGGWLGKALCSLLFAFSLAGSTSLWIGALVIVVFGCIGLYDAFKSGMKVDLTDSLIAMLLYILLAGVYLAAGGWVSPALAPDLKPEYILKMAHDIFMPVNQVAWQHYSRQYGVYYVILAFAAVSLGSGLWRSPHLRKITLLSFLWLIIAVVPFCGHAFLDTALYGGRWLYFAVCPLAILLAHACAGFYYAFPRFKRITIPAASLLLLTFLSTYAQHLWNQNSYYRNMARILRNVQKSISIASVKDNLPMLILCDLPEPLSVAPAYSLPEPACFDTATGLLMSNPIPAGRLKDLLRDNKYGNIVRRWEPDLQSFIPLDLSQANVIWPAKMTPTELSNRLQPGLIFYKTVSLDAGENSMVLESNSENGPMIVMSASELSPVAGDYMVLEARINAPPSLVAPKVELHWLTRVHEDYDKKQRSTYAPAIMNDRRYHKYYLSLRSNGWTAGGSPKAFALGFPAGSRVDLRSIEIASKEEVANLMPPEAGSLPGPRFTPPYYDYPSIPELGLIALSNSADKIEAAYSVANIAEATGILLEISQPDKSFDDANSNHLAGCTFKTMRFAGKDGKVVIPFTELCGPGVYSIRVIAVNERGFYQGLFSDPVCYQVPVSSAK